MCTISTIVPAWHGDDSTTNQVGKGIKVCREKQDVDPNFPQFLHSLAKLLDSQIDRQNFKKNDQVGEVFDLYNAVGNPPSGVGQSSRMPSWIDKF